MAVRGKGLAAVGLILSLLLPMSARAAGTGDSWPSYLLNTVHTSDNRSSQAITPANAGTLVQAWNWVPDPPTQPGQPPADLLSSPTVAGGHIYIGADTGDFYALDEATGTVLWKQFIGYVTAKTCAARGFTSTATVAKDPLTGQTTIYVGAADGYLYALRATDGTVVWKSLVVDPGIAQNEGYNWSSPTVAAGHVYMGMSSQCDEPLIQGGLKEFDQASGALLNTYFSVPEGSIGGSIWSTAASTRDGRFVFVTTGNSPTGAGDSYSIVRLDGTTLAKLDSWTVPFATGTDFDFGASPVLFKATVGGVPTQMVAACNKNGFLYAWKAAALASGPVWSAQVSDRGQKNSLCLPTSSSDGSHLFQGSTGSTISGVFYSGAIRAFDPATGALTWETGLSAGVLGPSSLNGAGVLAVPSWDPSGAPNQVWLVNAADGTILTTLSTGNDLEFAEPVFAGNLLLLGSLAHGLFAYLPAA
jgi:outer membrane protein assembly factor BamB